MEIERKFLINGFPQHLPLLSSQQVSQGYLCTNPEIRIRHIFPAMKDESAYVLCFKSDGDLCREEIELTLSRKQYKALKSLIPGPFIEKIFQRYQLPDGHILQCSIVDPLKASCFMYAEVEFKTVEEACAFIPVAELNPEVTSDSWYKMKNYWGRRSFR